MSLIAQIKERTARTISDLFKVSIRLEDVTVSGTKPEFEGNYTVVLFALVKQLRQAPEQLGNSIGTHLVQQHGDLITGYNVIKGFLNLHIADSYFNEFITTALKKESIGGFPATGKRVMVEYSSPNTNKPLHLGHLRNNFLGWSVAQILKATGNDVMKTSIVNDRGIHICKSMIAWQKFGNGATPASTGTKGDHFVGDYYVRFNDEYKKEVSGLVASGLSKEEAEKEAPIMKATQKMLVDWEKGEPEVIDLWKRMNGWVYEGFAQTYERIGSDFQKTYYESETYLLGKKFVDMGLQKGVFFRRTDGSVWIDLTAEGLDEKLVMRSDGTSVYITQDLGLAHQKYEEFKYDQSIYVIADEQNYHMKVLQLILKKLEMPFADAVFHLSYGMVELPTGRMKSREGTVVDADDLVAEMILQAEKKAQEKALKVEEFTSKELNELYETIALGALKFFLLKVDPKKRMIFNPEESIELEGFTGPFIQYTHARIRSILRRESAEDRPLAPTELLPLEKTLLLLLEQFKEVMQQAANDLNPATIANYAFNVAQVYNSFYAKHRVLNAESEEKKQLRLQICHLTARVIKESMQMLGIRVPERM
jgi:arginyl-tRNA synthetase